jgi:hypothetical protein
MRITSIQRTPIERQNSSPSLSNQARSLWRGGALGTLFLALLALIGTLYLYGKAMNLPFFFDDMIHLRWLDWHSLGQVWTTAEGLGYYRPLTMSFWKVGHLLMGRYDPRVFHTLSLLLHGLNAVLAGLIARRAFAKEQGFTYAALTTLLFLTFPFSYQAVPSTSSLSKPLIATLTLGSAWLYWEARRRGSRWLGIGSLILGTLAPFAYETGIMVPISILAVEAYGRARGEFAQFSRWPILYALAVWGLALPAIILLEPDTGASLTLPGMQSLWRNGIYFLEGLLYPFSFVTTGLEQVLAVDRYVLLTGVVLVGLAGLVAFYAWAKETKLLLYALSWFAVGILPQWLALDFAYVITSPRILYLSAAGSAMLWAGIPVLLWTRVPARWWRRFIAIACAAAMLAFGAHYVRDKMALAGTMQQPLWQAARAAESHDGSSSLLYVNVPIWIAPKEPTYRVGTEGLTFIPEYVRVQDFAYVNTGIDTPIKAVMFDPLKQDWEAYIGYAGSGLSQAALATEIRQADGVYLTTYSPDGLNFLSAGRVEPASVPSSGMDELASFGNGILLTDAKVAHDDALLRADLWWYVQTRPDTDITVFLHVYDEGGRLVAQGDGYPLSGLFPPAEWQPGEGIHDVRHVVLPTGLAEGDYAVAVGWYDTGTGERLLVADGDGNPVLNDAFPLAKIHN